MSIDRLSSSTSFPKSIDSTQRPSLKTEQKQSEEKQEKEVITKQKVQDVVDGMNHFLQPANTSLQFEMHDQLKEYYVKIIDNNTKEVIREIPAKKLLDTYASMKEFLGILFDRKI